MDEVGSSVLLLSLLTLLSLFFSLNTLALRGFSRLKLQEAFKAAGREDRVEDFLHHAERLTLACSFFRLLSNAGILLTLVYLMSGRHYLLTLLVAAVILEVFALAIPHSWSKHAGEYILPRTYGLLRVIMWLFFPFWKLFDLHDRLVRRMAGVPEANPEQMQEERQEEILSYVEQGRMEGYVDEEEMEMIESVLELGDTTAEEIMTPRTDLVAVQADMDLASILEVICKAGHSRIPVYGENIDDIVGLLYAKDLLTEIGREPGHFNLRETLREPYFVPETKLLKDLLHEFKAQKLHIAIVLDEYGGTAGIVTIEDILEELVGEIADEYEAAEPEAFKKLSETAWQVDARTYIDDVNRELDIELPEEEDYDTLGGFVFSHLGYIPKTGESFEFNGVRLTILLAEPRSVRRVRIEKLPRQESGLRNGGQ